MDFFFFYSLRCATSLYNLPLIILYHVAKLRAKKIPFYNYMQHTRKHLRAEKKT